MCSEQPVLRPELDRVQGYFGINLRVETDRAFTSNTHTDHGNDNLGLLCREFLSLEVDDGQKFLN